MTLPLSDPILVFSILISVILIAPLVAERVRIPDLVLLLLAGTILGPHGFGILARNEGVTMFGAVGLLYIMFIAGLDIDLYRFSQTRGRSVGFGLLTFAIPQAMGTLMGRYLLAFSWPTSILLASLFASHTLLTYPIVSRLGIARREPVSITVGATIITDIMALMVLAIIADMARGIELGLVFWTGIFVGLATIVWLARTVIPRLARWFFQRVPEKGGAQFLFVLAVVCGFAYVSHFAKMEPIIGAFLAGVAFNRLIPENSVLMNRVQFAGHTLFIPFFLISVGMLVDPAALLTSPRGWLVAGVMIVGVVASKWFAATLAARLFGYSREAGGVMFGLSVVQAAATLAAVLVGFQLDVFDATVLNGAIAMILVTCPLGAWMVDRHGRRMAAKIDPDERRAAPHGRRSQRMLVPVANPQSAANLLDLAFFLRDDDVPGEIQPLTIVPEVAGGEDDVPAGEKLLAQCMSHAAAADRTVAASLRLAINIGDGIVRAAKELRSDIVVMGWGNMQRGGSRVFGSALETIIDQCPSRIYIYHSTRPLNTTQRVLLPLPPLADRCRDFPGMVRDAKWLAKQIGAELHVYLLENRDGKQVSERIVATRPAMAVQFHELADWRAVRDRLLSDIQAHDLAFLPSGRRHGSFWLPGLESLPDVLAAKFPDLNVLAVYPPVASEEGIAGDTEVAADGQALRVVSAGGALATGDIEEALRRMLDHGLPELTSSERARAFALLARSADSFPVELAPGLVVLHGHGDVVDRPTLIVAVGEKPWTFAGPAKPARVMMGLISPEEKTGNLHLQALAELAATLRCPGVVERLNQAASADEACRIIAEAKE
ncbi:MAG: cation:proton antiporter [Lentisphaeria bacterium]|nr:cation:proton antiporter [Lentisphaeria bacterium]